MILKNFALSAALLGIMAPSFSFANERIECPQAPSVSTPLPPRFLEKNGLVVVGNVSIENLNKFMFEINKFPTLLNKEMVDRGAKLHVIEGSGVTADPSWVATDVHTFDGRPWSEVPGAGGSNVLRGEAVPTLVVANHLYDNHGSINLVLHERAHALDSLYKYSGVSESKTWSDLLEANPGVSEFLGEICTKGYCDGHANEGFAELFAYNFACQETKDDLAKKFPTISQFLNGLTSTEKILIDEGILPKTAKELEADFATEIANYERDKARYDRYMADKAAREEREARARQAREEREARAAQERADKEAQERADKEARDAARAARNQPQPQQQNQEPDQNDTPPTSEEAPAEADQGPNVIDRIVTVLTSEETKEKVNETTTAVVDTTVRVGTVVVNQTVETSRAAGSHISRGFGWLKDRYNEYRHPDQN